MSQFPLELAIKTIIDFKRTQKVSNALNILLIDPGFAEKEKKQKKLTGEIEKNPDLPSAIAAIINFTK